MRAGRPPILMLAQAGLGDMVRAVRASPQLFLVLLCAVAAANVANEAAPAALELPDSMAFVLALATSAAVTAGVAVTMHRFVILSETNTVASLASRWRLMLDFATVLFGAQFFIMLPSVLAVAIFGSQDATPVGVVAACVLVGIVGGVIILRRLMVLPEIAIEAERLSLRDGAIGLLRVGLPILLACFLATLVVAMVTILTALPLILFGLRDLVLRSPPVSAAVDVAASAATVSIVSRAYLWREGLWPTND